MLNVRAGKHRGIMLIALTALTLTSGPTFAITTQELTEQSVNTQAPKAMEPSVRLQQYITAHQQAKAQISQVDLSDPTVLNALLLKGKLVAAEAAIRLAQHYASQQKWSLADSLMIEALQLQPNNIANLQAATQYAFEQKNYGQAEKLLSRAIQQLQQQSDYNPRQLLNLKDNLASIYIAKSQYQSAEDVLQQNLQVRYQILDETHPDIADNLNRLATINAMQQELSQAEQQLSTALTILEPEEAKNSHLIADIKHNLAEVKKSRKRLSQTGAMLQ